MNIALGGSILNAAGRLRKKGPIPAAANLPTTIALAVNLGVPPLLFVQVLFGQFFYTSSVLMASYWLAVVPILILAYYAAYIMQRKGRPAANAAWSVVSAVLLLAIAFIYVNNMSLMLRYQNWPGYFADKRGLMLDLSDPSLFPRFFHFVIGSLAVASISWSAWAHFRERRGKGADDHAKKTGLKLFWIFTSIQMLVGLLWLVSLPKETMRLFMGGSAYATILLACGVLMAIGLLAHAIMGKFKIAARHPRPDDHRNGPHSRRPANERPVQGIQGCGLESRASVRPPRPLPRDLRGRHSRDRLDDKKSPWVRRGKRRLEVNYPAWVIDGVDGGLIIAIVSIIHVYIAHFAVGGGIFLVVTETIARRRKDAALLASVKGFTKFFLLLTMVAGGMTGVGIWFTIALVQPAGTSALIHQFVFGWATEWVFFIVEISALLFYHYLWDKLEARTHLAIGWIYAAAAWLSLAVIDGILSFMLTPGKWLASGSFWDGLFNPGYLPSLAFRTASL
jgi:hypothetical protein